MLECEASFTVALGYRDLKPAVVGTCALTGTELAGRYERLLHDLRTGWTEARGKQALEAASVLPAAHIDALEAGPEPRHFLQIRHSVAAGPAGRRPMPASRRRMSG